jgi:signal transduction histidine kinase
LITVFALTAELVQIRAGTDLNVVIEFLGGYAFAVGGLIAWRRRPDNNFGRLMTLVAVFWFIGLYGDSGLPVVPSLGVAFQGFVPIGISHLALTYPEGRLRARFERFLIVAGYSVLGLADVTMLLTFNPRRDVRCRCSIAPFGVFSNRHLLQFAHDYKDKAAGAVVLVAVVLILRRLLRANVTERWLLSPLWTVAAVAGATFIVRTAVNFVSLTDYASARVDDALNALTLLVPAVFLGGLLRTRLERSSLGDLVVALGSKTSNDNLERALARALRDPSVELAYWLPGRNGYVDAAGRAVALPSENGQRAITVIERDGDRLAAIVHDRSLLENPTLVEATTAATGLALDNERLQAELRAQIEEVQASRMRIIQAGDDARRRIERDLHDGAQQRLLATALSLRMATDGLPLDSDDGARLALNEAANETLLALTELRDLAQGIHPAILTEQGLRAAIEMLAERAPVSVTVDVPDDRYPPSVEATVYFVVSEALSNIAKHANATRVMIVANPTDNVLDVQVTDDGRGGAEIEQGSGLRGLQDRVVAVGGRLEIRSSAGEGTVLRIALPCS